MMHGLLSYGSNMVKYVLCVTIFITQPKTWLWLWLSDYDYDYDCIMFVDLCFVASVVQQ